MTGNNDFHETKIPCLGKYAIKIRSPLIYMHSPSFFKNEIHNMDKKTCHRSGETTSLQNSGYVISLRFTITMYMEINLSALTQEFGY
jgi:hypothetical protein